METCIAEVRGIAPLSWSRAHFVEKEKKELPNKYEERTWRERLHYDGDGQAFIPPMAFKHSIASAAKFLSMGIPGKGKATYTKHFVSGVMVIKPLPLVGVTRETVNQEWFFVPSDGRPGGGRRVEKCFPVVDKWGGEVEFHILDRTITEEVFVEHLREAGNFIGVGRFRPERGGFYGRFTVDSYRWEG